MHPNLKKGPSNLEQELLNNQIKDILVVIKKPKEPLIIKYD